MRNRVQTPPGDPVLDSVAVESQRHQLLPRHDAVLLFSEPPNADPRSLVAFLTHIP
jgi:hypothetical protein